jgi:hypothetical protein
MFWVNKMGKVPKVTLYALSFKPNPPKWCKIVQKACVTVTQQIVLAGLDDSEEAFDVHFEKLHRKKSHEQKWSVTITDTFGHIWNKFQKVAVFPLFSAPI